tara:strand:+ start:728 stop:910 length:183 start_codon:yes stop_codon:yes gene_type:complete
MNEREKGRGGKEIREKGRGGKEIREKGRGERPKREGKRKTVGTMMKTTATNCNGTEDRRW